MELSRRDALAALTCGGIVLGGGAAVLARDDVEFAEPGPSPVAVLETLDAVADLVYPAELSNVTGFVEDYSMTRIEKRPAYREGVRDAVAALDAYTRVHSDADRFAALSTAGREVQLQRMGVKTAEPAPGGTTAERIRYFAVNELLFALYSSPTGGKLVGIENPQGYPGGTDSYQRGPQG
jgi:hypothetical protein